MPAFGNSRSYTGYNKGHASNSVSYSGYHNSYRSGNDRYDGNAIRNATTNAHSNYSTNESITSRIPTTPLLRQRLSLQQWAAPLIR